MGEPTNTDQEKARIDRSLRRLRVLVLLLFAALAWQVWRERWHPDVVVRSPHYVIESTAEPRQAQQVVDACEKLYATYCELLAGVGSVGREHEKLKIKLYRDRAEFRRCNNVRNWAEGFYKKPYCYQYWMGKERNPFHGILHEATHQLNNEVAKLALAKWAEEGLACYLSTCSIGVDRLELGTVDRGAYPIWWVVDLPLTGDLKTDLDRMSLIPLRAILTEEGGPDIDTCFNLYYIHWWSLTHFLFEFEGGKYKDAYLEVIRANSSVESFETHVGPIEQIQEEWYRHIHSEWEALTGRARRKKVVSAVPDGHVRVAAIQTPSWFGKPARNRADLSRLIHQAADGGARIVVLPECAVQGYMEPIADHVWSVQEMCGEGEFPVASVAETVPGPSTEHFAPLAQRWGIYLCLGLIEGADGRFFNSQVLLGPDGTIVAHHRKRNPWPPGDSLWVTEGDRPVQVVDSLYGRLGLMVCYDVHALPKLLHEQKADIILYSVGWYGPNTENWFRNVFPRDHVVPYGHVVIAANWSARVGEEAWPGCGCSCVIAGDGTVLSMAKHTHGPEVVYADLPVE